MAIFTPGEMYRAPPPLSDPIMRVDYILQVDSVKRVHFVMSRSFTEGGLFYLHSKNLQGTLHHSSRPQYLSWLHSSRRLHSSIRLHLLPKKDGHFRTRKNVPGTSTVPLDAVIRIDLILQVDSILRVYFIMTVSLTERGWLFFRWGKCSGNFDDSFRPQNEGCLHY